MLRTSYDVVVLGGGLAGLATAISLRHHADLSVLVVEASGLGREKVGETVPPGILMSLDKLGLLESFRSGIHEMCPGNASVWGRQEVGFNDSVGDPMGSPWRLDRPSFDAMFLQAAQANKVEVCYRTRFREVEPLRKKSGGYRLSLAHPFDEKASLVDARWVVDATGAPAAFARAIGVKRQVEDQLFALVRFADYQAGNMTQQTLLEATSSGWWYAARLPGLRVVTLRVSDRNVLGDNPEQRRDRFEKALGTTLLVGPSVAQLKLENATYLTAPIYSSYLEQAAGEGWIAVGDAASSFDPIVGLGIYKALVDGCEAGRRVAGALSGPGLVDKEAGSYIEKIQARYREYSEERARLYGLEQRWAEAPFWRGVEARTKDSGRFSSLV